MPTSTTPSAVGAVPVTTPTLPVDEMLVGWPGVPRALVTFEMSEADYLALGETKHTEYYDGMCVVNPPERRHQAAEQNLRDLLPPVIPRTHIIYVEWGWGIGGEYFPARRYGDPEGRTGGSADRPTAAGRRDPLAIDAARGPDHQARQVRVGGLPWYWAVDIDDPSVVVMKLTDGALTEVQRLDGPGRTIGPVSVEIDPAALAAE